VVSVSCIKLLYFRMGFLVLSVSPLDGLEPLAHQGNEVVSRG